MTFVVSFGASPRKPEWLKVKALNRPEFQLMRQVTYDLNVRTICDLAHCPNIGECWSKGTATFSLLGPLCTRSCAFCSVPHGDPRRSVDTEEPQRVALAVQRLGIDHVVLTSVTRDDLDDGGAIHFLNTVNAIRRLRPEATVEVLIPDLQGDLDALATIVSSKADIVAHNLEVVRRLQDEVRSIEANYQSSLDVLRTVKSLDPERTTKSSLMIGLGERNEEVVEAMRDLREVEVDILTLGQYLRPGPANVPVSRYVHPAEFAELRQTGLELGFKEVVASPFARSSYHAHEAFAHIGR